MQQIGALVPLANYQFPQHPSRVYTTSGVRSNYRQLVMSLGQTSLHEHKVKAAPKASRSSPVQAVITANTNQDSNIRKGKYFEVEMEVRDTVLDQYGVVNNAIYISYIRNGHDKLLESLGISVDSMTSEGNTVALSEAHLKYIAPLRLVLEAKGTVVYLDKDYHATRIFPEVSTKFLQFFSSMDD